MYPTLQDIYDRDTIRKLYEIKKTKDFGYCPIVFRYPVILYNDDFLNKRYARLSEIWKKAKDDTEKAWNIMLITNGKF